MFLIGVPKSDFRSTIFGVPKSDFRKRTSVNVFDRSTKIGLSEYDFRSTKIGLSETKIGVPKMIIDVLGRERERERETYLLRQEVARLQPRESGREKKKEWGREEKREFGERERLM